MSGPSRTFTFYNDLSHRVGAHTMQSRFVLYDNGVFLLQYPPSSFGEGRFPGAYRDANGVTRFLFQSSSGRSIYEPWNDATGTLTPGPPGKGDLLTIEYQESMHHADFDDAVYVLIP